MRADLHVHSNCSDGSNTPFELPEIIKNAGIDVFALTDHDTIEGVKELSKQYEFIHGVELTCLCKSTSACDAICPPCGGSGFSVGCSEAKPVRCGADVTPPAPRIIQDSATEWQRGVKCHILGYGIDINNPELNALIEKGKVLRRQKLDTRIKYLDEVHGIKLTQEEKDWLYSRKSVVKTHVANILVNRGLAENNIEAMKKYLDDCKCPNTRFDGAEAINTIKLAGGIPVWAHPLGGEGERHLSEEEFLPKLDLMMKFGVQGLECYYSRYNLKEIEFLVKCAETNGLFISGGSDYHGTNKDIPAGRLNTEEICIESKNLTILRQIY